MGNWLQNIAIEDPIRRRQTLLFQGVNLTLIVGAVLGLLISLLTSPMVAGLIISLIAYPSILVGLLLTLWLARHGHLRAAVWITSLVLTLVIGGSLFPNGMGNAGSALMAMTLPVVLAGLLGGRASLYTVQGLGIVLVAAAALRDALRLASPDAVGNAINTSITFALLLTVLAVLLDRFRSTLLDALYAAQSREEELRAFQAALEATVSERTAELQATVDRLQSSRETIAELGAPVLPVLPNVLVAPLIGTLDSERVQVVDRNVLSAVERYRARQVIFDITGVTIVDTQVAQALIRLADAVRLLGAEAILVGIRPEVAQTMVGLGIGLDRLHTFPNLQEAITVIGDARSR